MDRYEYRLQVEQIERLIKEKDYKTAAKIADKIDWSRVKNLNLLYKIAEVYEAVERYDECMEILNIAYDRAPVGRTILYKMTELATKMKNFPEAISLYREFVKIAPHDQSRYILKYEIYKARGSDIRDQIKILKEYKSHEYQEEWAYELASLYAKVGMIDDCIRECDELILWFNEGKYVIQAMELKMKFAPLTDVQQAKYKHYHSERYIKKHHLEDTKVSEFREHAFSTINLQAELAENLDKIFLEEANIAIPKLKEPYSNAIQLEELVLPGEASKAKVPSEVEAPLEIKIEELVLPGEAERVTKRKIPTEIEFEELVLPGENIASYREEISTEIQIEELPFEEAEQEKPEEKKKDEVAFETKAEQTQNVQIIKNVQKEQEAQAMQPINTAKPVQVTQTVPKEKDTKGVPWKHYNTNQMGIDSVLAEWREMQTETEAIIEAKSEQEKVRKAKVQQETIDLMKLISGDASTLSEDVKILLREIEKEKQEISPLKKADVKPVTFEEDDHKEMEEIDISGLKERKTMKLPRKKDVVSRDTISFSMIQDLERSLAAEVSDMAVMAGHLTKEQAQMFHYFASVKGMGEQLSTLFKGTPRIGKMNSSSGNLVVTGRQGNGKTTLAIDIVKALQKQKWLEGKKLAKISAQKLNQRDISEIFSNLNGGALIIEHAGVLSDASMMALSLVMEGNTGGLLIILEGTSDEVERLFQRNRNFAEKFDYKIEIPVFSNDELVGFGKSYIQEFGYILDDFGVLALYDKIGSKQTIDHMVNVAEVKEILDRAMENAQSRTVRHLLEKVTKKNVDKMGNQILREEDFNS